MVFRPISSAGRGHGRRLINHPQLVDERSLLCMSCHPQSIQQQNDRATDRPRPTARRQATGPGFNQSVLPTARAGHVASFVGSSSSYPSHPAPNAQLNASGRQEAGALSTQHGYISSRSIAAERATWAFSFTYLDLTTSMF